MLLSWKTFESISMLVARRWFYAVNNPPLQASVYSTTSVTMYRTAIPYATSIAYFSLSGMVNYLPSCVLVITLLL